MPKSYIIYGGRKIVVINGQPFYESTGVNTKAEKFWFPMIMVLENSPLHWDRLSNHYNKENLVKIEGDCGYLVKYDNVLLGPLPDSLPTEIFEGRIPNKSTLITSTKLGLKSNKILSIEILEKLLDEHQLKDAFEGIELNANPDFETMDQKLVNQWLMRQGAIDVQKVLNKKIIYLPPEYIFEETHKTQYLEFCSEKIRNRDIQKILWKINNHDFVLNSGGVTINGKNYSKTAGEIITRALNYLSKDENSEEEYSKLIEFIRSQTIQKNATNSFWQFGNRDQSTVSLYNEIHEICNSLEANKKNTTETLNVLIGDVSQIT